MNKRLCIIIISAVVFIGIAIGITAFLLRDSDEEPLSAAELLDLGEKYLLDLDYEQALVLFTQNIEIEPMNTRAYLGAADAYLHLGRTQDAIDWLNAAIEVTENPNLPFVLIGVEKSVTEGYIALAEAYIAEGWREKALELLERVYQETGDEIIGRKRDIIQASEIVFYDDYIIEWKDPAFEKLIRQYLGKESGDIHYDDVKMIEWLEIWGQNIAMPGEVLYSYSTTSDDWFDVGNGREVRNGEIKTLADIKHFTSLKSLWVNYQLELDISALADVDEIDCLKRLSTLHLLGNGLTDISAVSNLIALNQLIINYNSITDISPLSMLIELSFVHLGNNEYIVSAEPLRGLRKLSSILMDSGDLNIFTPLPELKSLSIYDSVDGSALPNLTALESLSIYGTVDGSVLPKLTKLSSLDIAATDENFPYIIQLHSLASLSIYNSYSWNQGGTSTDGLTNISGIGQLSNLKILNLFDLNLTDISGIGQLSNLEAMNLSTPNVTNISEVGQLSNLLALTLDTPNCRDISPLASLPLISLVLTVPSDCDLTPLTQIPTLKTVMVPGGETNDTNSLINRVRALLPDIEVSSPW